MLQGMVEGGFSHNDYQSCSKHLPPSYLDFAALRCQVGYGKKAYEATKNLLASWGQFQLPWAQVDSATPIKPGSNVCVTANVFGLWTAVPLQVV